MYKAVVCAGTDRVAAVVLAAPTAGSVVHGPGPLQLGVGDGVGDGLGDGPLLHGLPGKQLWVGFGVGFVQFCCPGNEQVGVGAGLPPVQGWPKRKPGRQLTGLQCWVWPNLQNPSFLGFGLSRVQVWNG